MDSMEKSFVFLFPSKNKIILAYPLWGGGSSACPWNFNFGISNFGNMSLPKNAYKRLEMLLNIASYSS